jgi:serine/threonine protein kinase
MSKILRQKVNKDNGRDKDDKKEIKEIYPKLEILRFLGRGTFGSVNECYDPERKESKALKLLQHDKEEVMQNLKEIAVTSKINEKYPELIPRLNAFDTYYDKSTGYH